MENKLTTGSQSTSVTYNNRVSTLPSTPDGSICEMTFQGWTNDPDYVHGTSLLFTEDNYATASPLITGDTQFYAVFAEGSDELVRATIPSDIVAGRQIIIGYEADHTSGKGTIVPAISGVYNGNDYMYSGNNTAATGSGTIDISSLSDASNYLFTVRAGKNSGYFALEGSDGKYIGHNGKNKAKPSAADTNTEAK